MKNINETIINLEQEIKQYEDKARRIKNLASGFDCKYNKFNNLKDKKIVIQNKFRELIILLDKNFPEIIKKIIPLNKINQNNNNYLHKKDVVIMKYYKNKNQNDLNKGFDDMFNSAHKHIKQEKKLIEDENTKITNLMEEKNDKINYLKKNAKKIHKKEKLINSILNIYKNTIYFGAPGTGKSHEISNILKNSDSENNFRTTFHEAYNYSDFIGQYKPSMNNAAIEYSFCSGIFINALIRSLNTTDPVFLVIEELNRGNCAEIFGDVFQLLDRDNEGKSKYGINVLKEVIDYINKNIKQEDKIEEIKIPSNLYILSTMNTSDQSLFPIDSAFKRRWDMKYIHIDYSQIEDIEVEYNNKLKTTLKDIIEKINNKILENTGSEDKQIGQWFININNKKSIKYEEINNKILNYLFYDVFKHDREIFSELQFSKLIKKENFTSCFN